MELRIVREKSLGGGRAIIFIYLQGTKKLRPIRKVCLAALPWLLRVRSRKIPNKTCTHTGTVHSFKKPAW